MQLAWQWLNPKLVVAMVIVVATASAYVQWEAAKAEAPRGRTIYFDTPTEQCLVRGAGVFDDRQEWPVAHDGQQARDLIMDACAEDVVGQIPAALDRRTV